MKRLHVALLLAVVGVMGIAGAAERLTLNVDMVQPVLKAEREQSTFLKVGLRGFTRPQAERAPLNVAIVLDRSGSMRGAKMIEARKAAIQAVERLGRRDIISVVTYNDSVQVLVPATRLTDKQPVIDKVRQVTADGRTALFAGVSKGAAEVRKFLTLERANRIILVSDGLANVGPKTPSELGELAASLIEEGISVTTLGLGQDFNEDLLVQMARRSDGNYSFVEKATELAEVFDLEFGDAMDLVAQKINVHVRCAESITPVRVLNRAAQIAGRDIWVSMNQVPAGQQKDIVIEVRVPAAQPGDEQDVATATVSYHNLVTNREESLEGRAAVRFDRSDAKVMAVTNKAAMVEAIAQKTALANDMAVELRDRGRVEEARQVLDENARYLSVNAVQLGSTRLQGLSNYFSNQAPNIDDDETWSGQRKVMRHRGYNVQAQQNYDTRPEDLEIDVQEEPPAASTK
jgi:Ca-activated chloride channel family protein